MRGKKKNRSQNKARTKKVAETPAEKAVQPSTTQTESAATPKETEDTKDIQECINNEEVTANQTELTPPKDTEQIDEQKKSPHCNEQTDKQKQSTLSKETKEERLEPEAISKETGEQRDEQNKNGDEETNKLKGLALKKETEKQTDKQAEKQTDKQTEKQTDKHAEKQAVKQAEKQTDKQAEKQTDKQAEKQTDKQAEKQTDKQTEKQTDKKRELSLPKETENSPAKQKKELYTTDTKEENKNGVGPTIKKSATPITVKVPEIIKHPLENKWGFWLYTNENKKNWTENQKELTIFDTVEDYWCLYHHMKLPSELKVGQDYAVFKRGISPMWEDGANENGGRWVISLERQGAEMDRIWLDVVLLMIGENFRNSDTICGAVVNVRSRRKISVWTRNKNETANMEIGQTLKYILPSNMKIHFYDHKKNQVLFYLGN